MKKELTTEHSEEILRKQCEWIGVDYDKVDFTKRDWYVQHTWTPEQEKGFIDWLARFLIVNDYVYARWRQAVHEAQKINGMYGWKTLS
mgnify:CR=1 FL=1